MLLPDRGDLQTLFASCAWPTSCAEAKAKIFAETETREAPQETAADHEWNLTVQDGWGWGWGWAQPFTGRTKVERTSCLKSCSRSCGELGQSQESPPSFGLFALQEASQLQSLITLGTISGWGKGLPGQSSQSSRYRHLQTTSWRQLCPGGAATSLPPSLTMRTIP